MYKLLFLALIFGTCLSGCRYWVLYEFAEQFCEFEDYIAIAWHEDTQAKQVKIDFHEPVLDRHILLRYLNALPFHSRVSHIKNTNQPVFIHDQFAIRQTHNKTEKPLEPFQFKLGYHNFDEHALLESAYLDSALSKLFSPRLVEPILRSLCSDDYDLSMKRLNMRFQLTSLPKQSLPSLNELISVFGPAEETILDDSNEQTLRYEFDFLEQNEQKKWDAQEKPIVMLFSFDSSGQLKALYIHYHKYTYWLDVEKLSGRLLVIRRQ